MLYLSPNSSTHRSCIDVRTSCWPTLVATHDVHNTEVPAVVESRSQLQRWQMQGKTGLERLAGLLQSKTAHRDCNILTDDSLNVGVPRRSLSQNRGRKPLHATNRIPLGMGSGSRVNDRKPSGWQERQAYLLRFRATGVLAFVEARSERERPGSRREPRPVSRSRAA